MSNLDPQLRLLADELRELRQRVDELARAEHPGLTPWTTWTPTVTQNGSVSVTVTLARYCLIEKVCIVECNLAVTGSGTITNRISIGGQPAAIQPAVTGIVLGSFILFDSGTAFYVGSVYAQGMTDWQLYAHNGGDAVGIVPNFALASGDAIRFTGSYEVA